MEGVLRDEGRSGEAVRDAMGWVRFGLVVCARKADSELAYRRTFRDTMCGSLTASWDGYRWWLMAGGHVDN